MSSFLVALAAVWLAAALHLLRDPCSPVALAPALALGLAAVALRRRGPVLPAEIVLGAGLAGALVMHFLFPPAELPFARLAGYRGFAVMGLVLAAAYLCLHLRASLQRARFLLLVACFVVLALAAAPSWSWTFEAVALMFAALLLGQLGGPRRSSPLRSCSSPPLSERRTALRRGRARLVVGAALRGPERAVDSRGRAAVRCAFCAAGLLWPGLACEVPALGVGLFCAAAAMEDMP